MFQRFINLILISSSLSGCYEYDGEVGKQFCQILVGDINKEFNTEHGAFYIDRKCYINVANKYDQTILIDIETYLFNELVKRHARKKSKMHKNNLSN